ncbi:hypothetical protein CCR75_005845 [Bremia lactucae]|uniref:Uncharacterized protein n=1 Tax=Bremia lactucae TaxID=4779 RepID=A0A976FGK3_BRELC|nr:hypothetical protein CCR75_005845 [Bremia lactucae]
MTLKCWNATSPLQMPPIDTSTNVESLLAAAGGNQTGRAPPVTARCCAQSNSWNKDGLENPGESEEDGFDVTAATIAAPSHQMHAMPALWVSGRRRHGRVRPRRRTASENYLHDHRHSIDYYHRNSPLLSSTPPGEYEVLREAAAVADGNLNHRLRLTSPSGPQFAGWIRGQAAEVQWEALDPSVRCVRIDVCNVAWTVPTTIAHCVVNSGAFRWRRVYWGMPIVEGYYVNIYDVTEQKDPTDMLLLAQSERFAVIK